MLFPRLRNTIVGLMVAVVLPSSALAQEQPSQLGELIKEMTEILAGARAITVHVEKTFDDVWVTGEKLQFSGAIDIALRRPDAFHISYGDDLSALEAWYDGKQLALIDLETNVLGLLPARNTIDETLAVVAEEYRLYMPLAGLLSRDAYQTFADKVTKLAYIGLHDVAGDLAHHIYFSDGNVSWQLWIDAGAVPLPLKLVVTRNDLPGAPQSIFLFSDWNLDAKLPDETFIPIIPEGAALATFLPRRGE